GIRLLAIRLFDNPGMTLLLWSRLVGSGWLVISSLNGSPEPIAASWLLCSGLLLSFRTLLISDNAASMNHVTLAALSGYAWIPQSGWVGMVGMWFVASQLCVAYVPGGFAKLTSHAWRSGEHFRQIMSNSMVRCPPLAESLDRFPSASKLLSWSTIALQFTFPLALTANPVVCVGYLIAGLLFHAGIAFTMGLPSFFWAFCACYPASLWVNQQINSG
ncbi:MAG: hypothetical protein AAF514_12300, partial [Verrucomicrobiota bacterium]